MLSQSNPTFVSKCQCCVIVVPKIFQSFIKVVSKLSHSYPRVFGVDGAPNMVVVEGILEKIMQNAVQMG